MSDLTGILGQIAAVAGETAALKLAAEKGGTQIYVPPAPDRNHWLCQLLGETAAHAVADLLTAGVGPARVDMPLGPTGSFAQARARAAAQINAMIHDTSMSERDIARATGYTIRTIRRYRAKLRDDRQMPLF
ncbi:MAG: hypothetical protein COC10_05625 [Sphingobium sp.]|jgi:hypothetical protein|nr:MAG: hypothetical protein COC10_05625 [Sphingobium sp.]